MTKQTLYSLRTNIDNDGRPGYFITKFVDGEVESAYVCTEYECTCPVGSRPSCRHRQMLPEMLARQIVNTHWFWDFDQRRAVDFDGNLKSNFDAMNELAAPEAAGPPTEPIPPGTYTITQPDDSGQSEIVGGEFAGRKINVAKPSWRRM